ncbi:MAG: PAS domain S-box protein, partial [Candidatus Binatia bacterium]
MLSDYYRRKYADTRLDLIVAVMEPSLDFLLRHRDTLFSTIPIVFCGVDRFNLPVKAASANITGVLVNRAYGPTLETALGLQPGTRGVFVVGGTSRFDRQLQAIARHDFEPFERRTAITYLTSLSMDDLLERVSHLPPHSVLLYLTLFVDGVGRAFIPHDALKLITDAANSPVYVSVDQYLGHGAVGGHVYSLETHGRDTAEIGVRILRGESPANIPIAEKSAYRNVFDWRQLQRWGLDENRLPAASIIEFRPPTTWDRYFGYVVAALAIIAIQGAMIGNLLLNRSRRRQAEADLRESEERMSLAARAANLGFWMWDIARDEVWISPRWRSIFAWEKAQRITLKRFLDTVHSDDRESTRHAIDRALERGDDYVAEYRVTSRDGVTHWIGARGGIEFGENGRPLRMRGIATDITDRKQAEEALRESEERFRTMADAAPVMIWMSGVEKGCTFLNKSWLDFSGRTLEQELGSGWVESIHSEDRAGFLLVYD